jgi:hypothetical protein
MHATMAALDTTLLPSSSTSDGDITNRFQNVLDSNSTLLCLAKDQQEQWLLSHTPAA